MSQDINTIIEQLAEIDSASAKILHEAQKAKSQYAEQINLQKQHFDEELQKNIDKEIDVFQATLDSQNKALIAQYRIDCDKDIAKLEQSFNENGDKWAEDIFNNIIK